MLRLARETNQARGLARYALSFLERAESGATIAPASVLRRVELFHADAVLCGLSALALRTNAPTLLREEALSYARVDGASGALLLGGGGGDDAMPPHGCARVFGHRAWVPAEKAIVANCAAVREWDSNGTVFGFHAGADRSRQAGEFGHNDYYAACVAGAVQRGRGGDAALAAMLLLDEVRGRLCESFGLKQHGIDHTLHGAIATAAAYGALLGATEAQIESAIGTVVAHYVPWRAIRSGDQLSDSKGSSAAFAAEGAALAVHRAMRGFVGPMDIFRNPDSFFQRAAAAAAASAASAGGGGSPDYGGGASSGSSPFDLHVAQPGVDSDDWAVAGMHFKLGVYEHQSAGALHGLTALLHAHPAALLGPSSSALKNDPSQAALHEHIGRVRIRCYEPAFSIIGHESKRAPDMTRQSADHSMVFIVASTLAKALRQGLPPPPAAAAAAAGSAATFEAAWERWMMTPVDYGPAALADPLIRSLMDKISFEHGGAEYDALYPDGIPTSVAVTLASGGGEEELDSGLVLHPAGHARNADFDNGAVLHQKMLGMARLATGGNDALAAALRGDTSGAGDAKAEALLGQLAGLGSKTPEELRDCYDLDIAFTSDYDI